MRRDKTWRQDTPREQAVVLVQAAQGHLMNLKQNIGKGPVEKALTFLEQAQDVLQHWTPDGSWDNTLTTNGRRTP